MVKITVGADAEVMLEKNDRLVSAIGILNGDKDNPKKFDIGSIFYDNVNAEFNMLPGSCKKEFSDNVLYMLNKLATTVSPAKISRRSSANFPESELNNEIAKVFGCDPDYDAWTLTQNIIPFEAQSMPFRSVGGHVHIGNEIISRSHEARYLTIRVMDALLGIPSIIIDNTEGSKERRQLYGRAGCHRPTEYGVEYRTLSSFWIFDKVLIDFVYDMSIAAAQSVINNTYDRLINSLGINYIVGIINSCDKKEAMSALRPIQRFLKDEHFMDRVRNLAKITINAKERISI